MNKTPLKQKFLLICLSIAISLTVLEIGLRAAGAIYLWKQEKLNQSHQTSDEFRILCIGESTTALGGINSYPSQLERILREQFPEKKIKVINKGMVGATTFDLLKQAPADLDQYQPHLVILMAGVNDRFTDMNNFVNINSPKQRALNFLRQFRVYKFFNLLGRHIASKIHPTNSGSLGVEITTPTVAGSDIVNEDEAKLLNDQINDLVKKHEILKTEIPLIKNPAEVKIALESFTTLILKIQSLSVRMGQYYRLRHDYQRAENYLKAGLMTAQDVNPYRSLYELGRLYQDQKRYQEAIFYYAKAIEKNPDNVMGYFSLGQSFAQINRTQETYNIYKNLLTRNIEYADAWVYSEIGQWFWEHQFDPEAEQAFKSAVSVQQDNNLAYQQLAEFYKSQGDLQKASSIMNDEKAVKNISLDYVHALTVENYNKIVDVVQSRGIQLVCMQYPLRNIAPLKQMLAYKKGIIFVENQTNFEKALKESVYSEIFSDNFAINFGHGTPKGNRILAENVAGIIASQILDK